MRQLRPLVILIITIFIVCYLAVGVPKLFTIMAPSISAEFGISLVDFSQFLYSSGKYSLISKVVFSFLFNSPKFNRTISLYWLYFLVIVFHGMALYLCTLRNLNLHIFGRYTQGVTAGILLIILEPLIVNFSPDYIKRKLLHLKYECIALIAPLSILLTGISNQWRIILITMAFVSIIFALLILIDGKKDTIPEKIDPHLFSNFCKNLINPVLFLDSMLLGAILGIFLIFLQYNFIRTFSYSPGIMLAIMQGLPFTLSLIISKIYHRKFWKNLIAISTVIFSLILLGKQMNNHLLDIFPWGTILFLLVNTIYCFYVLFAPDIACSMIIKNPHCSPKSILTASQLLRSLSTVFITTNLNLLQKKNLGKTYYAFVFSFIIISILFLLDKKYKYKRTHITWMILIVLIKLIILYFLPYL